MGRPILYITTLQPLKERYTELWYRWFKKYLSKYFKVEYIDGEVLENRITHGAFLPVMGSYYWEFTQLAKAVEKIYREGNPDAILSMDIQFPGHAFALKYLMLKMGYKTPVFGWLHAGSYTRGDFVEFLAPSMKYYEMGWIMTFDGVFVASRYHKQAIIERRIKTIAHPDDYEILVNKLHPVGNPFYIREAYDIAGITEPKPHEERKYDIVIPDRPDLEKNIPDLLSIILASKAKTIAVVTGRREWRGWNYRRIREFLEKLRTIKGVKIDLFEDASKKQYYNILNDSRVYVTASREENFGYCSVEAMAFNVQPVLPNCCAFPEHVEGDNRFLYNSYDEAVEMIDFFLEHAYYVVPYVRKYELVLENVAKIIMGAL